MARVPGPRIYVAETAVVVGDVRIGKESSVWHGAVVRGDMDAVAVGEQTNLQDNVVVHVDAGCPTRIGSRVTVGHGAIVHGCEVGDECIVGMGSLLSSRAVVGAGSIVAPGAVVPEGAEIPGGSVVMGVPARVVRAAEDQHRLRIEASWRTYVELARRSLPARPALAGDPSRRVRLDTPADRGG